MSKVNLNTISNWLFYLGILVGVIGFYRIYSVRAALPPGVCPVDNNRGMLILGVFMLLTSVITAIIYERQNKRGNI